MSLPNLLTHTLTVQRKGRVSDGQGGFTEAYQAHLTTAGRINMASGNDRLLAAQRQVHISNAVFLTPGVDVKLGDKIICEGREYLVRVTNVDAPGYPYSKALVERILAGA